MQKVLSGETVVYSSKNELEKEFEFILPEYLPGISRIVKATAEVEKCIFSSSVSSAENIASLKISVIYISELGGKIKNASFRENVSVTMRDPFTFEGEFTAIPSCCCTYVSAIPSSPRKVSVKCSLYGAVSVFGTSKDSFFEDDGKDGICLLKEKHTVCTKKVISEEFFEQEAAISIDEGKPSAGEIICSNACFTNVSTKVSDGMIELDAEARIHVLYEVSEDETDNDSPAYALCDTSVPVSASIVSDKITKTCTPFLYIDTCCLEPSVSFDPYGSNKNISLNLKYAVSGFVYDSHECELITDGFSENYDSVAEYSKFTSSAIRSLLHTKDDFSVPVRADIRDLSEISSCRICVHSVSVEHSEGRFFANAKSISEIIGANAAGEIICIDIPVMLHIPFGEGAACDSCIPDIILNICNCSAAVKEGQLTLGFTACVDGVMTEHTQLNLLSSVSEDTDSPVRKNKGEIIICYPEKNSSLWSIAKKYRVSPEKIAAANKLEDGLSPSGNTLLIP